MDCAPDLEFHDDSGRALAKAKESILLIKKKMFRSHDLILQYNNKLKECEHLKGDLCVAKEEATKLKRENNANLSKVVKLEMQSADYKKFRQELEQKIAEKDIQIASDKSHVQQLECKLKAVEDKNVEKEIEAELKRSSLEVTVKELEQQLKALKKSHLTEINKLERALKSPKAQKGKKIIEVVKETQEIGVNTVKEIEQPKPVKPATVDKRVLTDEFYHIQDNPYPLFCDRCESSIEPRVEKICKIMTHPPLVGDILSPVRRRVPEVQHPNYNDPDSNRVHVNTNDFHPNESMRREMNLNNTSRVESNSYEFTRVDPIPRNFVSPLPSDSTASSAVQKIQATPVDATAPELHNLRRKIATLERIIKKQTKQKSSDSQPSSANCCSHPHPMNYFGHSSTHVNPVPNVFPNMQADLMTEFFNKMMNFANERNLEQKTVKVDSRRKGRTVKNKRAKIKSRKLKKITILKKSRNRGSRNWEIESDDCDAETDAEKNLGPSNPTKPHLLRIKPSNDIDLNVTLFSDAESEILSPVKDPCESSFPESQGRVENSPEKVNRIECDSNQKSVVKIPDNAKISTRGRKRARATLFDDDGDSEMEVELVKNKIVEDAQTNLPKDSTSSTRTRSKSLRDKENERKSRSVEKTALKQQNVVNSSLHSAINESCSPSSDGDVRDMESSMLSQNSALNEPVSNLEEVEDDARIVSKSVFVDSNADQSDAPLEICSDVESLEGTNRRKPVKLRKRKRSSSPKTTKRTGRSNLLGKLRALKKNSIMAAATTNNSSTIPATRSLSRRKLTEQTESEDRNEPSACVQVKKQRIAHVPKKATSPQPDGQELPVSSKTSKLIEFSDEICDNNDEISAGDCMPARIKRPLTRQLAVEKLAQSKLKNDQKSNKSVRISRVGLSRTKKLALVDSGDKTPENQVNPQKAAGTSVLPKIRDADSNGVTKEPDSSLENIGVEKEQISKIVAAELARAADGSIVQLDRAEGSLTPSISAADAPIDKTGVARALPVEKPSASIDVSPASPAALVVPLGEVSVKPAEISISLKRSGVSSNASAIDDNELNGNYARNSILMNEIDAPPACTENSMNKACLVTFAETRGDTMQNAGTLDESKVSLNGELANKTISTIPNESPASPDVLPALPDATRSSPVKTMDNLTSQPIQAAKRLSIYDNVALSIPLEKAAISSPLNNFAASSKNATIFHKFALQDTSSDVPIEKPIERSLLVYDTNLYDNSEDERDEFDSSNIANPHFFVDTSVVGKKKATQNPSGIVEPINVVKELRSRQVLCSPSTSAYHQNLQKTQNPVNDEAKTIISSDAHVSQLDCYSGVRSLGTLLNHYLCEQKKKSSTPAARYRRAGAIKLQETAEKNVKVELNKLAESEEWTSELHQSVIARLLGVSSERTVAKSIVDFLVERASLDEPLDRTYTPPAPVMTRTQQRIVTLINCLERAQTTPGIFELVQAGIEYTIFKFGFTQPNFIIEYLVRIFTVISRIKKDRERVRILCCDAFYCIGRRALPAFHVILTVWPEVLPKHGAMESILPSCLVHMINLEQVVKDPFPKVMALKKMMLTYYDYPENQMLSAAVMKILIKSLHEKYSYDLETAILLLSKKEGHKWALENVIEKGLMTIIQDENYQWKFEVLRLLGFILRSIPVADAEKIVQKFVDLLCQMLDSGEGSQDKQEGVVSALLSLSRYRPQFLKISDSVLKWMPSRELRTWTLDQLDSFFKLHSPVWWNLRLKHKMEKSGVEQQE